MTEATKQTQTQESPEAAAERQRHLYADMIQGVAGKVRRGESLAFALISLNRAGQIDEVVGCAPGVEVALLGRMHLQTLKLGTEIAGAEFAIMMQQAANSQHPTPAPAPDAATDEHLDLDVEVPANPFLPKDPA